MRTYVRRRRKAFRGAVHHTERAMTTEPDTRGPSRAAIAAVTLAALAAGALVVFVALASDHREPRVVWAVFGPLVGWSFVAAGLYAWRIRPQYRTGELMILLGFAWFLFTLDGANDPTAYTFARILGGLWGSVFLHLGLSFPTGRLVGARGPAAGARRLRDLPAGRASRSSCSRAPPTSAARTARRTSCWSRRTAASPTPGSCSGPRSTSPSSSRCCTGRSGAGAGPARSSGCS